MKYQKIKDILAAARREGLVKTYVGIDYIDARGRSRYALVYELLYRRAELTIYVNGDVYLRIGVEMPTREVSSGAELRYFVTECNR